MVRILLSDFCFFLVAFSGCIIKLRSCSHRNIIQKVSLYSGEKKLNK